jgi:DNA-directed RNA polymerase alpha subunit
MDAKHKTIAEVISENPHRWQVARQAARMLEIAVLRNNRQRALAVVDYAFLILSECTVSPHEIDEDLPIGAVISGRLLPLLQSGGVHTVKQLCSMTADELMQIKQVKEKAVGQIVEQLRKYKLRLVKRKNFYQN